jgi:pimeloyl-ACP methyl ester carboxylesterase
MTTTPVLLHGAGTGPWVWQRTMEALETTALAPELGGRSPGATPAGAAEGIVRELDGAGVDRVLLVLHSLAGVLAGELANRLGERLRGVVLLAAVVPPSGSTFARSMGFPARLILPLLFRFNRDGLRPSEAMIRAELCNDLDEADARMVVERYAAEFPGLYLTRVATAPPLPDPVYVRLSEDRSVPPARQDAIVQRLGIDRVVTLPAGHLAMLSRPDELTRIIHGELERADVAVDPAPHAAGADLGRPAAPPSER